MCLRMNGVSRTPRPFAEEHPRAVPMGAAELPMAASWGHHRSPFPVLRLPKSLETHQRLSPAACLERAGNDPFALEGSMGKRSVPGVALSLYFCRTGDGRSLQKSFIICPIESFALVLRGFLPFKTNQNWSLLLMFMLPTCKSRCT